jgi:hypothetical protein
MASLASIALWNSERCSDGNPGCDMVAAEKRTDQTVSDRYCSILNSHGAILFSLHQVNDGKLTPDGGWCTLYRGAPDQVRAIDLTTRNSLDRKPEPPRRVSYLRFMSVGSCRSTFVKRSPLPFEWFNQLLHIHSSTLLLRCLQRKLHG